MGSDVAFFCGDSDTKALSLFIQSQGLHLVPMQLDKELSEDPAAGPYCYISTVEVDDLNPYGDPPVKIGHATDPVMGFLRAYHKNNYLVLGHIRWSNDAKEYAALTKPAFNKIKRWIAKEWEKYGDFYMGPEAKQLVDRGAKRVNFLPNKVSTEIIKI